MDRLNKYLAHAGVGSRRHCDDLIRAGRVSIDGQTVRELGTQVAPGQRVAVDGAPVRGERHVYWLVHKPRGYLCTNHDPARRPLAIDLVPHVDQRVYTVGRLDEDSEGLLLLTNDGDLANRLMHPRFGVDKTYLVQVAGSPKREDLHRLTEGIWLSDGHVKAKSVKRLKAQGESTWLRITLSEGKNREIRRMLAKLGHKVMRLRRTAIGPVEIGSLSKGKSRRLSGPELESLRYAARGAEKATAKSASRSHAPRGNALPRRSASQPIEANADHGKSQSRRRPSRPLRSRPERGSEGQQ
jgi:23S rRNA pseudouridine2605 synthase